MELLLRDVPDRCELTVEATKLPVLDMESVSVAFPFRVETPTVRYDRQLGWVEPRADHGPGSSNEWLSATSAVTVTAQDGPGVIWAAPDSALFSSSDLVRGVWPERFAERNGYLYAYVMNNFWPCNTPPTQPGRVRFRYVFAAVDRHEPASASRFGAEARLGALAQEVTPLDRFTAARRPRFEEGRLLDLGDVPDCRVFLAGEEEGLTLRIANLRADENRDVVLRVPDGFRAVEPAGAVSSADGRLRPRLSGFGVTELFLRRGGRR
uniref:Alpha-mannosidase n=1 Tax=Streptomyces sp. NBC_01401 TaxID=2903854 RepID=A0AAU3H541_9ACTN